MKPAQPTDKPKSRHGGARPNSGRKPKAITVAKRELAATMADAADYAFRFFDETMRDAMQPIQLRLECAGEVLNRAWGRPRPAADADAGPIVIEVRRVAKGIDGRPARTAPEPGGGEG